MNIKERFNDVVTVVSGKAKRTYEHIRLDMKIKAYEDEIDLLKKEIGEIVFSAWEDGVAFDMAVLEEHFEGISTIKRRLNRLNKKKEESLESKTEDKKDEKVDVPQKAHKGLLKKENDLRIGRTQGGIGILRICPNCNAQISHKVKNCDGCGMDLAVESN